MYPVYLITCTHPSYGLHAMPYVGCVIKKGKTVEDRLSEHFWERNRSTAYIHRAIKKYGREWFQIEQIDAGNTPEQAKQLEKWWIARLKTKAPEGGYNLTDGGDGNNSKGRIPWNKGKKGVQKGWNKGKKTPESTLRKMREVQQKIWQDPEHRARMSEVHKGITLSVESKRKCSEAAKKWWREKNNE